MTIATFAYGPVGMNIAPGITTDANGQASIPTGASGGSNAGDKVLTAIRVGMIPAAPKTAGFVTASAAATSAIAAISASPTQSQIVAACNALLAAVNALTAA
jgi:hypothetical protein